MIRTRPPLVRMQHIDRELRENRFPNCSRVAGLFSVCRKSIQRDIEFMRDQLGAPIDYDSKRKGYFYSANWFFDPSAFIDQNEAIALSATRQVLAQYQGTPYYDEVCRAINKLMQALPASHAGNPLFDIYSFDNPSSSHFNKAIFSLLENAIRDKTKVRITYHSASTMNFTERVVCPYRLHHDQSTGTWYLIAWCEYRNEVRTFAVNRIQKPVLTGGHFAIPESFSIKGYLENAFDQTVGPHRYDIAIRFTSYQSQWIREQRWHSSQQIGDHEDGSLTLRLKVSALDAVKRWVMRYGAQAEVLEPPELRDMVSQEVREMGEVYGTE